MDIRKLREQRGWSQEQLAEMSGLSTRTVQRIEGGETGSAESLKSLAAVFEIPLSDLLPNEGPSDEKRYRRRPVLTPLERKILCEVRAIRGFHWHFASYVIVCSFMVAINLLTPGKYFWAIWPIMGWGIGIAFHALAAYKPFRRYGKQWERREFDKRMAKRQSQG